MSHLNLANLKKSIKFIKKHTNIPICIDTEGAQIRTKVRKKKYLKFGEKIKITNTKGAIKLYPESVYKKIKINDILSIGFHNLKLKVIKKKIIFCVKLYLLENLKIIREYIWKIGRLN